MNIHRHSFNTPKHFSRHVLKHSRVVSSCSFSDIDIASNRWHRSTFEILWLCERWGSSKNVLYYICIINAIITALFNKSISSNRKNVRLASLVIISLCFPSTVSDGAWNAIHWQSVLSQSQFGNLHLYFKTLWSQFGTDLRQCSCISNSAATSLSFSITIFIPSIFPLSWMGRCWLPKTNHMTIQPPCSQTYTSLVAWMTTLATRLT